MTEPKTPDTEKLNSVPTETPPPETGIPEIASLLQDAQSTAGDSRSLMEPKSAKPKGKGGRPRKDPNDSKWQKTDASGAAGTDSQVPPLEPPIDLVPALQGLFSVASILVVSASGVPEAKLESKEIDSLAQVWSKVLDKYLPNLTDHPELMVASIVTATVGFRVSQTIVAVMNQREEEKARAAKPVQNEPLRRSNPSSMGGGYVREGSV